MQFNIHQYIVLAITTVALLLAGRTASSAEIQIRRECRASSPVVRLGDIADIYTTDAAEKIRLANVELFAAPNQRASRRVTSREIQDALVLRGIAMGPHRFSGSATARVYAPMSARATGAVRLSRSVVATTHRKVSDSIVAYLQQNVNAADPWQVKVELTANQTEPIATASGALNVRGGAEPWTGRQRYIITAGTVEIPVDVQVTLPPRVVVAVRAIGRGELVHASDVELKSLQPKNSALAVFHNLKDVVGKEAVRPIAAGQIIPDRNVRAPILVGRGEVVTVYAYSGGVRVRTTARAQQNGSLGDLVEVESLDNRQRRRFMARVAGVQRVEVFAKSVSAQRVKFPQTAKRRR